MKKNGFIATSLIYSFFLMFITLFLGVIADYLQNKVLLEEIEHGIKKEINDTVGIKDFEVGDVLIFASGTYNTKYNDVTDGTDSWIVSRIYVDSITSDNSYMYLYSYNTYADTTGIVCLTVGQVYDDLNFGYLNNTYLNKTLYNFNSDKYLIGTNEYTKDNRIINIDNINGYRDETLGLCRKRVKLTIGNDRLIRDPNTMGDSITLTGVI